MQKVKIQILPEELLLPRQISPAISLPVLWLFHKKERAEAEKTT